MPKVHYSIRLESVLLKRAQKFAEATNRSVNNFIECAIIEAVKGKLPKENQEPLKTEKQ
jgi:hypothetical protein